MAPSRTVIIAGAGIGGLTAALALTRRGFRAVVLEQAQALEPVGAGIQLSPNATRVLIGLGLADRLAATIVVPEEVRIMSPRRERPLARIPLGAIAPQRYGAPYWVAHRGDLQQALVDAATAEPDVTLKLGVTVDDFAAYPGGLTVAGRHRNIIIEERGLALVAADGLWSALRKRMIGDAAPRFAGRVAWRATIPASAAPAAFRDPAVHLWLGHGVHLVHYPVRGGREVNIVAIVTDPAPRPGWSAPGARDEILARFARWPRPAQRLIEAPQRWSTWALHDRAPAAHWGRGPATLLGDAAHPMLPFLAQGGAMAIEDADVLAKALAATPEQPDAAFRAYEKERQGRTAKAQRAARRTGRIYGLTGPAAFARNTVIRFGGSERLLARQDWLYAWEK